MYVWQLVRMEIISKWHMQIVHAQLAIIHVYIQHESDLVVFRMLALTYQITVLCSCLGNW